MSDKLTPQTLLAGYASGVFPMAHSKDDPEVFWVRPDARGIFPLDQFHVSRSLARHIRKSPPEIRLNSCFSEVVKSCADRDTTWISDQIFDLYGALHEMGFAHSFEVFDPEGAIWGGVYGVTLGTAFFGESMFSRQTNGSKVALTYLTAHLKRCGFTLFDTQFLTDHLASLGAIEIDRSKYEKLLSDALVNRADFQAAPPLQDFHSVMQLITQTS